MHRYEVTDALGMLAAVAVRVVGVVDNAGTLPLLGLIASHWIDEQF